MSTTSVLFEFLLCCFHHPRLEDLNTDDIRIAKPDTWSRNTTSHIKDSSLRYLSLSACSLTDTIAEILLHVVGEQNLDKLTELSLNNNPELSMKGVDGFIQMTKCGELSIVLFSNINLMQLIKKIIAPNGYSLLVVGVPQSGGLSGGNTVQIVSTYPASPEARPPSFFGKPAVRPRSPTQDQNQH